MVMFGQVLADMRERAKMPCVGHGDKFYIVSTKLANVKGGAE